MWVLHFEKKFPLYQGHRLWTIKAFVPIMEQNLLSAFYDQVYEQLTLFSLYWNIKFSLIILHSTDKNSSEYHKLSTVFGSFFLNTEIVMPLADKIHCCNPDTKSCACYWDIPKFYEESLLCLVHSIWCCFWSILWEISWMWWCRCIFDHPALCHHGS